MSLINSKNIKRLMLLIISLLTAMLSNIASNGGGMVSWGLDTDNLSTE